MKKIYIILILLVAGLTGQINAQSPWAMQNIGYSVPSAYPFDIDAVDANTVWTVAYSGDGSNNGLQLFSKTSDGGVTWTSGFFTSDTSFRASGVAGIDSVTGYVLTYNNSLGGGSLFKTTDGGTTWNTVAPAGIFTTAASFPDVLHFWDAANGIVMGDPVGGYYEIYRTADSGATWTRVPQANIPAPVSGEYGIVNDFATLGDKMWFGTNKGRIYISNDRGLNWTVNTVISGINTVSAISFRDSLTGLVIKTPTTGAAGLFRTNDGGNSWTQLTWTGPFFTSDIKYVPGTSAVISCAASTAGRGSSQSTDDGASWVLLDTLGAGTNDGYTSLDFIDSVTGWAGGFAVDQFTSGIFEWGAGIVGLNSITTNSSTIEAYPNPFNDNVYLNANESFKQNVSLTITDLMGKTIKTENIAQWLNPHQLSLGSLTKGVYFIRIESGNSVSISRIIRN